jgi:hypothetical protein
LAVALLLVGCGGGGRSARTADATTSTVATGRCHTDQLQARIQSTTATITVVSLTDTAAAACVLEGYARLELLDRTGAVLPVQPTRLTDVPTRRLTLKPGGAAVFELHARPTAAGGAPCTLVTPARLRITPPDETDPLTVEAGPSAAGCDNQYGVTAMQAAQP